MYQHEWTDYLSRDDVIAQTQCWSLLLPDSIHRSYCGQASLDELKSMNNNRVHASPPALIHDHFAHELINQWQGWLGERVTAISRRVILHFIIKIKFCWGHLLVYIYVINRYLHFLPSHEEVYPPVWSSSIFIATFQSYSFQVPSRPTKPLAMDH